MEIRRLHPWNVTPKEAAGIQKQLREIVATNDLLECETVSNVAGCDVSYSKCENKVYAIVVVLSYPQLSLVEAGRAICEAIFPYVPGLLVFREGPSLLQALKQLTIEPDVLMFDGHGAAHPREMGIASHMGIILDKPAIGVAKTALCGEYKEPGKEKGSSSPLTKNGKEIGAVLRTKNCIKPVFVSVGYRIDLEAAEKLVLNCCRNYRLPEPIRQAHLLSNKLRASK